MKEKHNIEIWRKLDNSAKIFPISTGKKYSTVFRLSAILKEKIDLDILKKATDLALKEFDFFKVNMKRGFFWYYLEQNTKNPIIEKENEYPCQYIDPKENNGYLFKVTYFENKINLDVYHVLTDGNTASVFFREIVYCYLELKYPNELSRKLRTTRKLELTAEDSYLKNYDKKAKSRERSKKAYILKGKKIPFGGVSAIHAIINLEQLKQEAKKKGVTVTQYLTAMLFYAIYKGSYCKYNGKKPIKICIPINLKKYFHSNTVSNFFSYMTIEADMRKKENTNFDTLLELVKTSFKEKLTEEEIQRTMSANVKLGNHIFIKMIPLFLKKPIVRLSYLEIRKYTTTTLSNIGRVGVIGAYKKYIDNFFILIAPEEVEKIKCSACSYENKMVVTFTSILKDARVQEEFVQTLKEQKIDVEIESNGVIDVIS